LKKVKAGVQDVAPFLFPTEISKLQKQLTSSLEGLSCGFAKIINGLQQTFEGLLDSILNKFINAPMCAAENIVSSLIDGVLGQITDLIDSVVGPLASFITGLTGKAMNLIGSAFNALNMVMGILTFFQCDEEPSCAEYNEIDQCKPPTNGDDQSVEITNANIIRGASNVVI
jgi:phage-related protein